MRYSKGLVLYQDNPEYGSSMKVTVGVIMVVFALSAYYLVSTGEREGALVLLIDILLVGLILFSVTPRSYRVYEDHLRIMLGGPFSFKVPFEKINSVEIPGRGRMVFGTNFATRITGKYVGIFPKKGLAISITPKDSDMFVEEANRAMSEWAKTNQRKS